MLGLAIVPDAGAYVYWANNAMGTNTIGRADTDGTDADQSFITGADGPAGAAVNGSHIYWANAVFNGSGTTIGRAGLDGSGVDQDFITGASTPSGVAADGAHVYWVNQNVAVQSIGRANADGTGVDQSFITGAHVPGNVAVDGQHVYWTNVGTNAIGRANLNGTNVDQSFITTGIDFPIGLAVDSGHIYWANLGLTNSIGRATLAGGSVTQNFITGLASPCGVAVDAGHLYWGNSGTDSVGRADLDGTNPDPQFITGADDPCGIAVDSLAMPSCQDVSTSTGHAQSVDIHLQCTGGGLTHAIVSGPSGGQISSLDASSGNLTYTPNPSFSGRDTFTFKASNPSGASPMASATIDVAAGPPVIPASNAFTLGKPKLNKRKGTAKLPASVPGPGALTLLKTKRVKAATATASDAGQVRLRVRPRGGAKKTLIHRGKAKVTVQVTFSPVGGTPSTATKKIKLVRKDHSR
jgi:Bacterial Ig domain/Low-density lipoprotein receptor repeat class B